MEQMMSEQATGDVLTRDQIAVDETWDLTTMFADDQAWEAAAAEIPALIDAVLTYRGRLYEGPETIDAAFRALYAVRERLQLLVVYAALRKDEDQTAQASMVRYEKAVQLSIRAGEALSWFQPELVALPEEQLKDAIKQVSEFRFLLQNTERERAHVLSDEVEQVLAQMTDAVRTPGEAMSALDNADIRYGKVVDESGDMVTLTKGRYASVLESRDRDLRKRASDVFHKPYLDHVYTLGTLHASSVKNDVAGARIRKYRSAQSQALFDDNVPESVYSNLIETVRSKATPVVERYLNLRKRALGLDDLQGYDLRVPLAPEPRKTYTYQQATDIVLTGLNALGATYVGDLGKGFASRWVDVHETKGKRSGAYSWGAYGAPPVMLMNWNSTLSDVFTLAHESGHSMHSFYAQGKQPIQYAGYSIFLAEIASTVNEVLLSWHLLGEEEGRDPVGRFGLLNRFADTYFGTVIRQTMFAEFEQQTHAMVESGGALTPDWLSNLYGELFAAYTPGIEIDDAITITWARIPHFYNAFYVYQYATGMSSAINIATAVRDEGEPARKRYLEMLGAGGSDYPMNVLKRAGVDLETPAPIEAGVQEFDRVIAEMERLADEGALEQAADALETPA